MHTGGKPSVSGNTFTIEGNDGATMKGTFLQPPDVRLTATDQTLRATGGSEFFVVMTVQQADAPEVQRAGAGAKVGRRTLEFANKRIGIR
jgi:hypothetical protein